jgi:glutathione S-transferase
MKLYYYPGACSLAVHITLREAGYTFDTEQVDLGAKKTAGGADYLKINPKGYVPALALDDGQVLTEVAAILQYLADRKPESGLAPKAGTMEHYRLIEWLNFISSEVHKAFGPLWSEATPAATKQAAIERIGQRFDYLASVLGAKPFLTGDRLTVADAYLFTMLGWAGYHKLDLGKWPVLQSYSGRIASLPAVTAAMKAEGLIQ